jgi:hypothetical protein
MEDAAIELGYVITLLPPGRFPFRRWRWELWNGPQLLATGWRLNVLHAQRALRAYASRYVHRRHGLVPLRPDAGHQFECEWRGRPVTLEWGDLRVELTPRALAG